ncbi:ShTK domain protein [Trichostrongylus colubriformis]|uniref:ShTK domain protein n=1 Tax=Trichostrongylus colubriformis TaxID=6319 RepID=A0AAN8EX74_TRICO
MLPFLHLVATVLLPISFVIVQVQIVQCLVGRARSCVDKVNAATGVSDCASMDGYCNNAAYYTLMSEQCPRTCGRCTLVSSSSRTTCVDRVNAATGVSDCPSMVGYCRKPAYLTLMRQQCPKTCGYCTSG